MRSVRAKSKKRRDIRYTRLNPAQPKLVLREVDYIVARAAESDARVVTLGRLVFFSTQTGDAWLLDPEDHLALRLANDGGRLPVQIVENGDSLRHPMERQLQLRGRRLCRGRRFRDASHHRLSSC